MAESKNVAAYRKTRQEGDPAAAAEAEGTGAKLGLELQDAESKRPGAGKSPAPGDNTKPGTIQAEVADDPRRNRPATRQPAPGEKPLTRQKNPDETKIGGKHGPR